MTCPISAISILLVEDNLEANEVVGQMLSMKFPEFTFYFAANGREGVDIFKKHTADIIITDIDMPVIDGIQMALEIKAIKADTKFIVLTGYSDKKRLELFSEIRVADYLKKPIMFNKLFAAIEKCVAATY